MALGFISFLCLSCGQNRTSNSILTGNGSRSAGEGPSTSALPPKPIQSPLSSEEFSALKLLIQKNGNDVALRMKLVDYCLRAGNQPEAAHQLRTIIHLNPNHVGALQKLSVLYREANYLDREFESLRSLVQLSPDNLESKLRLAEIEMGQFWLNLAEIQLNKAVAVAPRDPQVFLALASFNFQRHEWSRMETNAREGLKTSPNSVPLLIALSDSLRLQNRLPEAEQTLILAISLTSNPNALTRRQTQYAHLLLERGWKSDRSSDAEATAAKALLNSPDDLEGLYWLARSQEIQGKVAEAVKNYERAAAQDIQFESVSFFLGHLYQRSSDTKKRKEGQRLLEVFNLAQKNGSDFSLVVHSLKTKPDDLTSNLNAAQWYSKLGKSPQAILTLRRMLELYPANSVVKKMLSAQLKSSGRISEASQIQF